MKDSLTLVEVQPHNSGWSTMYEQEVERLQDILGSNVVRAHHVGSTAIPHIWAKPIVDIILEDRSIPVLEEAGGALTRHGYQAMGEYGIKGRRYFRKYTAAGVRTHHLHAYAQEDPVPGIWPSATSCLPIQTWRVSIRA